MSISIYLHIPFCTRLCPYCHFYRVPEVPDWQVYLDALVGEMTAIVGERAGPVSTIYAGGGTPTLLSAPFHTRFLMSLGDLFDTSRLKEASIETDGDVTGEDLTSLAAAGYDRVSIGVKSFLPRVRDLIGAGDWKMSPDPVKMARESGFSSVGLDLLYGIEGQTMAEFSSDLDRVVILEPDHVSLYALEEPGSGRPRQGDPDAAAAMFRESARTLRAAGYCHYEITNFAKPGHRCLHNMAYWQDGDFIGLGPSAHSCVTVDGTRIRWRNRPDIGSYLKGPASCREELVRETGEDRARQALIMGLRMAEGVPMAPFTERYGFEPLALFGSRLGELRKAGLIRYGTERVRLTTRGMLLSNEVFVRIL